MQLTLRAENWLLILCCGVWKSVSIFPDYFVKSDTFNFQTTSIGVNAFNPEPGIIQLTCTVSRVAVGVLRIYIRIKSELVNY